MMINITSSVMSSNKYKRNPHHSPEGIFPCLESFLIDRELLFLKHRMKGKIRKSCNNNNQNNKKLKVKTKTSMLDVENFF